MSLLKDMRHRYDLTLSRYGVECDRCNDGQADSIFTRNMIAGLRFLKPSHFPTHTSRAGSCQLLIYHLCRGMPPSIVSGVCGGRATGDEAVLCVDADFES